MSILGQPGDIILRSNSVGFYHGHLYPKRTWSDWHQLVYAREGTITIRTSDGIWAVPPQRAVLVPAGAPVEIQLHRQVKMRSLYIAATFADWPARCQVVGVTPLLRELILHMTNRGVLHASKPDERRLAELLCDLLQTIEVEPLALQLPTDPRLIKALAIMEANPAVAAALDVLADRVGTSRRTLNRVARAEMGISFGRWREQVRIYLGVRMLADGLPVSRVAAELGYASASAFIVSFRRHFSVSPGRYFQSGSR
ncbi:MAG: helix-turn-helix domain-containing protein [Pseudomonadota bacterium]